jgi:hypothetical protein
MKRKGYGGIVSNLIENPLVFIVLYKYVILAPDF